MKELVVIDAQGNKNPIELSVSMYKDAASAGQSLPQYLATLHPTNAERDGTAFEQVLEQSSIFVRDNKEFGLRSTLVGDILNPAMDAAAITREGVPVSRTLFPAILLDVVENKLELDYTTNPNALNMMVAVDEFINGERFERPVISYSQVEEAKAQAVQQLSMPNAILKITSSDRFQRIPTWGIGLEISEQAQKSTTIDMVTLALSRQLAVETHARADAHILSFLQGDPDIGYGGHSLASIGGKVRTAQSFDASILAAGTLTQTAWLSWISLNNRRRQISHIVTDLKTAMAIEARTGKPTNFTDNPNSPRIDTFISVLNPKWANQIEVYITDDPNWPANTIMGIDKRYAIHRVTSLTAQYSAIEEFAIKRSTMMRMDWGNYAYRIFDDAFEVLTLTV